MSEQKSTYPLSQLAAGSSDPDDLMLCACSPVPEIRLAALENRHATLQIAHYLQRDPDPGVRQLAEKKITALSHKAPL